MQQNSWFGDHPASVPPRHLVRAIREVVAQHIDDLGLKPHGLLPLAPLAVPRASFVELSRAAVDLLALLRRAVAVSGAGPAERLERLGIAATCLHLFQDDPELEDRFASVIARADVAIGRDGPQFLEFNVAGAVGGPVVSHALLCAWSELAERGAVTARFDAIDPLREMAAALARACEVATGGNELAVIASLRDYPGSRSPRRFELELAALRGAGLDAQFYEPEEFAATFGEGGVPSAIWTNFTVAEWAELGISVAPVVAAANGGSVLIPSQSAYLVNSKRIMALLSEGQPWMSSADAAFVRKWLPWTRTLADRNVVYDGRDRSLTQLLVDRQAEFVIKHADGMKGGRVWVGRTCDSATWSAVIESAVATTDYIVQRYVEPQRCAAAVSPSGSDAELTQIAPVVSPFVFDDKPGGVWARFTPDAGTPIVAREYGAVENLVTYY